jgi:hypothetical protein
VLLLLCESNRIAIEEYLVFHVDTLNGKNDPTMKDWPDPRFPERKTSRLEIGIVGAIVIVPTALFLWGLIARVIRSLLPS